MTARRTCSNCVADTSDLRIRFDANGACDHCQAYYNTARACLMLVANSMIESRSAHSDKATQHVAGHTSIALVFMSQSLAGVGNVIADNELTAIARLRDEFSYGDDIRLFYNPQLNNKTFKSPARLSSVVAVNGRVGTLFVSFFLTCQIHPAFKGLTVLLRGDLIYLNIAIDNSEAMLHATELVKQVKHRLGNWQEQGGRLSVGADLSDIAMSDVSFS
jgi:hypothetical protein